MRACEALCATHTHLATQSLIFARSTQDIAEEVRYIVVRSFC